MNKELYEQQREEESSYVESQEAVTAVIRASKRGNIEQKEHESLVKALEDIDVIVWDVHDIKQADVPAIHLFELTDDTSIHLRSRQTALRHNTVVRKEVEELFQASSFPVVIATKRDGIIRFRVDYLQLNKVMKPDPKPKIQEPFGELLGAKVFTTLESFTGYWQVRMSEEFKEMTIFL